jgi:mannose-6-phosphate isomerase-like protein (cupin superfamily)
MMVRRLMDIEPLVASDKSLIKEILHPDKFAVDIRYSMAYASVKPHQMTKPHRLEYTEVYHIVKGQGQIHINNEAKNVTETDTIYIPPGAIQFIENTGQTDLEFLCIVDPAWKPDIETVADDKQ